MDGPGDHPLTKDPVDSGNEISVGGTWVLGGFAVIGERCKGREGDSNQQTIYNFQWAFSRM